MATRALVRSIYTATRHSISRSSVLSTSSTSHLSLLRPVVAAAGLPYLAPGFSSRGFCTETENSSLNLPDQLPKQQFTRNNPTILLQGCDFEHWLVVMDKPEGDPTREEIIHSYVKTLALVTGSTEEARNKIYSVSTRHYYAFGVLMSEELSYRMREMPRVQWVLPDSYVNKETKDYGGEPFIAGEAVAYEEKYHAEWLKNRKAKAKQRRDTKSTRSFQARREAMGDMEHPSDESDLGSDMDESDKGSI